MNKLLFCLFAEDIGLLPKGLFTRILERTRREPGRFEGYARDLFGAMRSGGDFLLEEIPRFNGGLYETGDVVALVGEELATLAEAARLDWGSVEPAIFGTLFERSLDPAQRARLGAPGDGQWAEISAAAKRLDELRRNWLDPEGGERGGAEEADADQPVQRVPDVAHEGPCAAGRAVYAAYGWPEEIPDEEILKNLLALNLRRSEGEGKA